MRRSAGLLIAASALGASALLIPSGIQPPSSDDLAVLSFRLEHAKSRTVDIHCSSCAFTSDHVESVDAVENGGDNQFWTQNGDKTLILQFSVSEDGQRLQLNGETIYPLHLSEWEASPHIHVPSFPSSLSVEAYSAGNVKETPLEVTGALVKVNELVAWSNGDSVIRLTHNIVELERQAMALDNVSVQMLKTSNGQLLIQKLFIGDDLQVLPESNVVEAAWPIPQHPKMTMVEDNIIDLSLPPPPNYEPKECNVLPGPLCRLKTLVATRIMEIQQGDFAGCAGRKQLGQDRQHGQISGHIRPHFTRPDFDSQAESHFARPHHSRPHGYHHRHQHHHRHHRHHFVHAFARGVAAVLIPTLAGVAVGMIVSLFGLFVGRIISFVWINLVRGGRRGYARVPLEEGDSQKAFTVQEEDIEPPPVYEDAPAYEEAILEPK